MYPQRQILRNSSSALSWTWGPLLKFPAKCVNFEDPKLNVLWIWLFYVVVISLTHVLPAWLLALTLCMYASIHIRFFLCLVLNSNNFGRFQIYFKPIRCSLETKHFLRVLRPLKPPLGSQNTPEPPAPLTFATLTFPPIVFTPGVMSDICMYGTQLKKTSNAYTFFFKKKSRPV